MRATFFIGAILFIFITSLPAHAADPEADTQALKSLFQNLLDVQKEKAQTRGALLSYDGNIQIEQADDYYAVTLPHAKLNMRGGNTLDIGMLAINANRAENPDHWSMSIAIPTPLIIKNEQGQPLANIKIGQQKATGLWNEKINYFTAIDALYKNIEAQDLITGAELSLRELALQSNLKSEDGKHWSGPIGATLEGLSITHAKARTKIDLETGKALINLFEYNPLIINEQRETLKQWTQLQNETGQPPSSQAMAGLGNLILDILTKGGNGFSSDYTLTNLSIIAPQKGADSLTRFMVGRTGLGFDAKGFLKDDVTLDMRFNLDTLDFDPLHPETKDVIPQEISLNLNLSKIPLNGIADTLRNTFQGTLAQNGLPQFAAMALIFKLPALLSEAGATLDIQKSFIRNDTFEVLLNGKAIADIKAVNNLTADFTLLIYDYDYLVQALRKAAAHPKGSYGRQLQDLANFMASVKSYAVREKAGKDTDTHRFHFVIAPDGKITVNDKPVSLFEWFSGYIAGQISGTSPAE